MNFPSIYSTSIQATYDNYSLFSNKISTYLQEAQNIATNIANPTSNMVAVRVNDGYVKDKIGGPKGLLVRR